MKCHTVLHSLVNSIMTAVSYQVKILRSIVRSYVSAVGSGFLRVLDNGWTRVCWQILVDEDLGATEWLSHSSDMNLRAFGTPNSGFSIPPEPVHKLTDGVQSEGMRREQ